MLIEKHHYSTYDYEGQKENDPSSRAPGNAKLESENFSNLTCGGGGYFSDLFP